MPGVLGTVVLFEPDKGILDHVKTYIDDVDELLIIDNSDPASPTGITLERTSSKVKLIRNHSNVGIARALNQAAEYGLTNGYEWLLTMDQDSNFELGALRIMKDFVSRQAVSFGIVSPFHHTPGGRLPDNGPTMKEIRITMTSGNLLNLKAFQYCGSFDEKLFIDSVDHEYCLRLRKNGYKLVRLNTSVLHHRLGNITYHDVLGMRFKTTNHNATRKYYITRNRLHVITKYIMFDFRFFLREIKELFKSFWAVLFFENNKGEKVRAMLRGTWHFVTGRYGKL